MRWPLVAVLVMCASACGGSTAASRSAPPAPSRATAGRLPDRIFVYRVTDAPKLAGTGGEVVDYDPATGEARDRSGIGTAIRELVVVNGAKAVQVDWQGDARTDTIVTSGSPRFVRENRPVSVGWMLDAYLRRRRQQPGGRIGVSHVHGHLVLTSRTDGRSVALTLLRTLDPTRALVGRLFAVHPGHVTERVRQLRPEPSGTPLPGAFSLGRSWRGRTLDSASVDAPVAVTKPGEVTYTFTYGRGRIQVSSGLPSPHIERLLADARIFGRPHPCRLGDGTAARVYQFAQVPPSPSLGSTGWAQVARFRIRRVVSANVDASIVGLRSLLPSLAGTCAALRPFAGR